MSREYIKTEYIKIFSCLPVSLARFPLKALVIDDVRLCAFETLQAKNQGCSIVANLAAALRKFFVNYIEKVCAHNLKIKFQQRMHITSSFFKFHFAVVIATFVRILYQMFALIPHGNFLSVQHISRRLCVSFQLPSLSLIYSAVISFLLQCNKQKFK